MIHQMAQRAWGAGPSRLHLGLLVDLLLDEIERMGSAILPAQVGGISCSEIEAEKALDQIPG